MKFIKFQIKTSELYFLQKNVSSFFSVSAQVKKERVFARHTSNSHDKTKQKPAWI